MVDIERLKQSYSQYSQTREPIPEKGSERQSVLEGVEHGQTSTYRSGCRCKECRAAAAAEQRDYLKRSKERFQNDPEYRANLQHGSRVSYLVGCRCEKCVAVRDRKNEADRLRSREKDKAKSPKPKPEKTTKTPAQPRPIRHGTEYSYNRRKCRCTECRAAHNEAQKRYYKRRRAREKQNSAQTQMLIIAKAKPEKKQ